MKDTKGLYVTLGIDSDATIEEIKRAFRTLMFDIHPDRNGGEAHPDHDAIQHAYDVLSDTDRREKYDRDGDDSEAVDIFTQARQTIAAVLMKAINDPGSLGKDFHNIIVKHIDSETVKVLENLDGVDEYLKRIGEIKRKTKVSGKAMFIMDVIDNAERSAKEEKLQLEQGVEVLRVAKEILSYHEYEFEAPGYDSGARIQFRFNGR